MDRHQKSALVWTHLCVMFLVSPNVSSIFACLTIGEELSVAFGHDDYSIWLSASKGGRQRAPAAAAIERPLCVCGVHTACSRTRVSMLNNSSRTLTYINTLTKVQSTSQAFLSVPITPPWKVLRSLNLRHSTPLEMLFHMVSFLAEVKIFNFWPETMDYSQAFWLKLRSFFVVFILLTGRCYEAEICTILLLLRCSFI